MEEYNLCGRPGKCCPIFKKEGRKYSISDNGQKVLFTKKQLYNLYDALSMVI